MITSELAASDPRVATALDELRRIILDRYPSSTFEVESGGEPEGIWLVATVDADNQDEVMDPVIDRVLELQFEQGLPVHVLPLRTPERNVAVLRELEAERQAVAASV